MRYGWNLKSDKWHNLERAISRYNWSRAYLHKDYTTTVPENSGIYVICASTENIVMNNALLSRTYNAIYTGQSKNLRRRFTDHIQGYREVKRAEDTFGRLDFWYSTIEQSRLSEVEQLFIDTFGPSANVINAKVQICSPVMGQMGNAVPAGRRPR